eukprot:TRINITY_DN12565_c0_g1_i1.p1 TRINITY_DN12565_c0_g1~~TRINITY_DN12565_c0_g1_i1.p1  ORF type:complete len:1009 (-),score=242.93 TRINITY_DN12565_c0_g1_i1:248-3274(-)
MALVVQCVDGARVAVPEAALRESRVLGAMYEDWDGGEEAPLLAPVCLAKDLEAVFGLCPSSVRSAGLSWSSEAEFAKVARVAHCAHYLDMPKVLAAVILDFAEALLKAPSLAAAAERFYAPPWALQSRRTWPELVEDAAQRLMADLGRNSCLGTRAQILAATWVCEASPLFSLPEEIARLVLERAEALCEEEFGSAFTLLQPTDGKGCQDDMEKAFAIIEARREQLSNSPLATSVAVTWALAPSSRRTTRAAAVKALRAVCTFGDAEAFTAFFAIVDPTRPRDDEEQDCRQELEAIAFEALPIVVAKDDDEQVQAVVEAASASILHEAPRVRAAAVACLGAVARDPPAVFRYIARSSGLDVFADCELAARSLEEALESSLHNEDPRVRRAAAEAIGVLAKQGGVAVAERLLQRLAGAQGALVAADPELRSVSVLALKHLMVAAELPGGWTMLVERLQDLDEVVRNAARMALMELAGRDDGGASADRIIPLLQRSPPEAPEAVRSIPVEVATAIAHVRPLRDKAAWSAEQLACGSLHDAAPSVRAHALRLLRVLGGPRDALDAVVSLLKDDSGDVRLEACRALTDLAPRGDAHVAASVATALAAAGPEAEAVELAGILKTLNAGRRDAASAAALSALAAERHEASCRVAALRGLEAIAPMGHEAARNTALRCASSPQGEVAAAAVNALRAVCAPGDKDAVAALLGLVVGQVHTLRPIAVSALAVLSPPGDPDVLAAVRGRMGHGHWPVRAAALQAFAALAPAGCPESIGAVQPRLQDTNCDVRQIAVEVLVSLAAGMEREVCDLLTKSLPSQPEQVQLAIEDAIDILMQDDIPLDASRVGIDSELENSGNFKCDVPATSSSAPSASTSPPTETTVSESSSSAAPLGQDTSAGGYPAPALNGNASAAGSSVDTCSTTSASAPVMSSAPVAPLGNAPPRDASASGSPAGSAAPSPLSGTQAGRALASPGAAAAAARPQLQASLRAFLQKAGGAAKEKEGVSKAAGAGAAAR